MLQLYHFAGAYSRVTMNALEEIDLDYADEAVNLRQGLQGSEEYLRVNPKGKVPALVADGFAITENPAILTYLHQTYPEARLLPKAGNSSVTRQASRTCSGAAPPRGRAAGGDRCLCKSRRADE